MFQSQELHFGHQGKRGKNSSTLHLETQNSNVVEPLFTALTAFGLGFVMALQMEIKKFDPFFLIFSRLDCCRLKFNFGKLTYMYKHSPPCTRIHTKLLQFGHFKGLRSKDSAEQKLLISQITLTDSPTATLSYSEQHINISFYILQFIKFWKIFLIVFEYH